MSVIPNFNEIKDLIKKGATFESQEKIMELREIIIQLQQENILLKNENKSLIEKQDVKVKMEYDESIYWLEDSGKGNSNKDDPFCPTYFDNDKKSIRLQKIVGDEYI
ncbi:MAG: hypothetical protein IIA58_02375 [Candidatus Marinimicrobia bacterium]|nr:hypothetical protein [Candidatus Neomarinimicrobiota bacterium]